MSHDVDATCPNKKLSGSDWEILISDLQAIPHLWNDGQPDKKENNNYIRTVPRGVRGPSLRFVQKSQNRYNL
jgi:hypothetical protein